MKRSVLPLTLASVVILSSMTGCTNDVPEKEVVDVYIQYNDSRSFMIRYGPRFESEHSDIRVTVIDDAYEGTEQPDILFIPDTLEYQSMEWEGQLAPLESFILRDGLTVPSRNAELALDIVRGHSNNVLYALPLQIRTSALFYNKDLFDEFDIPYPTNNMTWRDILLLAQRFPAQNQQGEPIYGLTHAYIYTAPFGLLFNHIARAHGLHIFDAETWTMTVDTPEWRELWEQAIAAFQSGHVYLEDYKLTDIFENDFSIGTFESGHAAMIVNTQGYANSLTQNQYRKVQSDFDWQMAAPPVNPDAPDYSNYYYVAGLYAISADSDQKEAAWTLLKFMFESEFTSGNYDGSSPTGPANPLTIGGRNIEHLYQASYAGVYYDPSYDLPDDLFEALREAGNREIMAAVNGEKTIDEALKSFQAEGQVILNEAKRRLEKSQ